MRYRVRHQTIYTYSEPVQISHNLAHLRPLSSERQIVSSFALSLEPRPAVVAERTDGWGNSSHFLLIQDPHREFRILAESELEIVPPREIVPASSSAWEAVAASMRPRPRGETALASQFLHPSPFVPLLGSANDYARESFRSGRPLAEAAQDLMHRIHREFRYDPEATSISTPLAEVFARRRGVCQDFSHAMLACLRSLGLPARYVSGYLETRPPPGKPRLVGADASHAWIQFWCPEVGWIDLDPTNDVAPSDRHVIVATGRDFGDVTPFKGLILGGGGHSVQVSVDVMPLDGEPAAP